MNLTLHWITPSAMPSPYQLIGAWRPYVHDPVAPVLRSGQAVLVTVQGQVSLMVYEEGQFYDAHDLLGPSIPAEGVLWMPVPEPSVNS